MFVTGANTATAMQIARYHAQALAAVEKSSARIAADRRFTSFAEDPAAATREISLRAQQGAAGLHLRATQDAVAAADAASDGLQSVSDILLDLRNAVLGMDVNDAASVSAVQNTVTQLTAQLTRIADTTTTVGGTALLDGSIASSGLTFTVAASGSASDEVELTAISVAAADLGDGSLKLDAIDFGGGTTQAAALAAIDQARTDVTDSMATTGGVSSAMGYHANAMASHTGAITSTLENLVGVDVAEETLAMTRNTIRAESAAAMLAQVNALHVSMVRQLLMYR
jgi:flagellin-like hook-associated protein FlgL